MRVATAVLMAAVAVASCAPGDVVSVSGNVVSVSSGGVGVSSGGVGDAHSADVGVTVKSRGLVEEAVEISVSPMTSPILTDSTDTVHEEQFVSDSTHMGVVDTGGVQAANPVTIRIPSIKVEAPIIGLGILDDGSIEVPEGTEETGWWRDGPEPGEQGPAVILGHVDSRRGPAVFYNLKDLKSGDQIHIDREDGTTVTYSVDYSERHGKDAFPTDAVYGATENPTLRLVTCSGSFDRSERSYIDNLIVFASIVD